MLSRLGTAVPDRRCKSGLSHTLLRYLKAGGLAHPADGAVLRLTILPESALQELAECRQRLGEVCCRPN
jgi:hypothetical protein